MWDKWVVVGTYSFQGKWDTLGGEGTPVARVGPLIGISHYAEGTQRGMGWGPPSFTQSKKAEGGAFIFRGRRCKQGSHFPSSAAGDETCDGVDRQTELGFLTSSTDRPGVPD